MSDKLGMIGTDQEKKDYQYRRSLDEIFNDVMSNYKPLPIEKPWYEELIPAQTPQQGYDFKDTPCKYNAGCQCRSCESRRAFLKAGRVQSSPPIQQQSCAKTHGAAAAIETLTSTGLYFDKNFHEVVFDEETEHTVRIRIVNKQPKVKDEKPRGITPDPTKPSFK